MTLPTVEIAGPAQQRAVVGVVTLAFATDPIARATWPDPGDYLVQMPSLVTAFGGNALDHATAFYVEGFRGAALWLPPGVHPDREAIYALMERTVAGPRRQMLGEAFKEVRASHPEGQHWYLPLMGIDPAHQNQGLGSLLMRHANTIFDRDNVLAYLESSNPRSIPFYERHGYEMLRTIRSGDCPPISPMLRRPRG